MRTIDHVDAEAFERTLKAARVACDAYDSEREAELLRQVLAILVGSPISEKHFPESLLVDAVTSASQALARRILDTCWELGQAILKHNPFNAIPWIEFVEEQLALEHPSNDPWLQRMTINLLATRGVISAHLSENSPIIPSPMPQDSSHPSRGAGTVQRLAQAMANARRLEKQGRTAAAINLIKSELSKLDLTAPMADEIEQLAHLLIRELSTSSNATKRKCCRNAISIFRSRSAHEAVLMLLRCAGYAQDLGRRELVWEDLCDALCETHRPGAQALRWLVINYMAETELKFGYTRSAICLTKLALREYQDLRRQLDKLDPELARLTPAGEMTVDRLISLLVEVGRLDEAEQAVQMRLAPDLASTISPQLTMREREIEILFSGASIRNDISNIICIILDKSSVGDDVYFHESSRCTPETASLIFIDVQGALNCLVNSSLETTRVDLQLSTQEANHLAYRLRQAVTAGCSTSNPILRECFDALLRKPLEHLPHTHTLRIGAIGGLRNLPWAALHDGDNFLVQIYALQRLTAIPSRHKSAMASKVILVSFGASQSVDGFGELGQDAVDEVRAVASISSHGYQLFNEDFNVVNVERAMRSANIVHFVTHFILNPATPDDSRLILGNGEAISLDRLIEMPKDNLDLLILSCCSSAIGGSDTDHSVVDRLVLAGVGAVFGTLWKVDNAAMSVLVPAFVDGLRAGLNKAEALALAQRDMIDGNIGDGRFRLPCFFAGSVIAGDLTPWHEDAFKC